MDDCFDFLRYFLGDRKMEQARKACSGNGCTPTATFKMSYDDCKAFTEMEKIGNNAEILERKLQDTNRLLNAKRVIFWESIKERIPEYDGAYRLTVNKDAQAVEIYTKCTTCLNPKEEEE